MTLSENSGHDSNKYAAPWKKCALCGTTQPDRSLQANITKHEEEQGSDVVNWRCLDTKWCEHRRATK